jgi:hypothetical protein
MVTPDFTTSRLALKLGRVICVQAFHRPHVYPHNGHGYLEQMKIGSRSADKHMFAKPHHRVSIRVITMPESVDGDFPKVVFP